jgi:hypothetical protein
MSEEKVSKLIDEIFEMLRPLSLDETLHVSRLCDHITAWRAYFGIPMIIEYSKHEDLKRIFMLSFEAQLAWIYHVRGVLTDEERKDLIWAFCKVFSPGEFDQVFEKMKEDIRRNIEIVKGVR